MRPEDEEEELRRRQRFNRRALLLGGIGVAGFAGLAARLYHIQVMQESRYGLLAETNRVTTQILPPARRGRILDRFGEILARGDEAFRAMLMPSLATDIETVLGNFARVVPLGERDLARLIARARRQRPNEPIILAADLTFEQAGGIAVLAPQLPGVEIEVAERRVYPRGALAGHTIGHVGHVEQVAVDDDPVLRMPWIKAGRTGLERGQERTLAGSSGRVKLEVDARGRIVRTIERREPVSGRDVISTIDVALQEKVTAAIAGQRCAAAVMLDIASGEVVAMAAVPGYDPGAIADGLSAASWKRMVDAADDPMLDRATAGQYPPASTFKMVTALAALEAGVVGARDRVDCHGSYAFKDQTYRCWNRGGHGRMDLVAALRESCDVYFYEMAVRTGIDRIAAMARRLGIGDTFDCGLALGRAGVVPDSDWKIGTIGRRWMAGETLHAAIGQGFVLATPLQLAVMAARIASGREIVPRLVRADDAAEPYPLPRPLGIADAHLEIVRRGMHAAVNSEGGTAGRANLDGVDAELAGKTGTAEVTRGEKREAGDTPWELRNHALFVAYAPYDKPRYALSVVVEHGGSGGSVAAPIARTIMTETLRRDPMAMPPFTRTSARMPAAMKNDGATPPHGRERS